MICWNIISYGDAKVEFPVSLGIDSKEHDKLVLRAHKYTIHNFISAYKSFQIEARPNGRRKWDTVGWKEFCTAARQAEWLYLYDERDIEGGTEALSVRCCWGDPDDYWSDRIDTGGYIEFVFIPLEAQVVKVRRS